MASKVEQKCYVKECRYSQHHFTKGHQCGNCHEFGHGRMECGNRRMIDDLKHYRIGEQEVFIKLVCPTCRTDIKISHSQKEVRGTDIQCVVCLESDNPFLFFPQCGHVNVCKECCNRMDKNAKPSMDSILIERIQLESDMQPDIITRVRTLFDEISGKIYISTYGGMGCSWFVRRDDTSLPLEAFFMHSDSWGQYGPDSDDRPLMNKFIENYTEIPELVEEI